MAEQQQGKHSPKPGSAKDVNARHSRNTAKHAEKKDDPKTKTNGGKKK